MHPVGVGLGDQLIGPPDGPIPTDLSVEPDLRGRISSAAPTEYPSGAYLARFQTLKRTSRSIKGGTMRWFTDEARQDDGDAWDRARDVYAAHLRAVGPRLLPDLARLATDPQFDSRTVDSTRCTSTGSRASSS